ncbi:hypothetical protein [Lacrimispora xylanisolvens]|uniref:hypothetical protein n=1 Tax=Lacrimispora xylanisolvens TaxID=384636 RepID=UPI002402AFAA
MSSHNRESVSFEFKPDDFIMADNRRIGIDRVYPAQSYWKDVISSFLKNKGAAAGFIAIVFCHLPGNCRPVYEWLYIQ